MRKSDVLGVLALLTGGAMSVTGEGAVLGVPMLVGSVYLLSGRKTPTPTDLTAKLASRGR